MAANATDSDDRPATASGVDAEAPRPLTVETVRGRLSVLGKNPYSLAFVYTTATLGGLRLADLDAIGEFPNLQHVVCSHNQLRSLAALRDLRLLLSVDASHNQLTHTLDFDVPLCAPQHAWVGGGEWIGSLLRRADLSSNRITSVRELSAVHPFLQELHLAHNDLREIRGLCGLRFLRLLDLSYNRLTTTSGLVPPALLDGSAVVAFEVPHLEALEVLRLGHNQITSIDEVVALPRLVELDVAHNRLATLHCLEHCYRLQRLNVGHNELAAVNELNFLLPLPFLERLTLVGCPLAAQEPSVVFYRARVLRRLQQLAELDGEQVTAKEKIKALAMHGSEVASRKQVLAAFLPGEDFVNYLPPLDYEDDAELATFCGERFGHRVEEEEEQQQQQSSGGDVDRGAMEDGQ